MRRLQEEHRGDARRLAVKLAALGRRSGTTPPAGSGPLSAWAAGRVLYELVVYGPALRGPLRQGLHDRAAATLVVAEARSPLGGAGGRRRGPGRPAALRRFLR